MKTFKMSWNTDGRRLVCRWVESEEHEKYDSASMLSDSRVSCRTRSQSSPAPSTKLNWDLVFGSGRAARQSPGYVL